jgi:hypothetical protein
MGTTYWSMRVQDNMHNGEYNIATTVDTLLSCRCLVLLSVALPLKIAIPAIFLFGDAPTGNAASAMRQISWLITKFGNQG